MSFLAIVKAPVTLARFFVYAHLTVKFHEWEKEPDENENVLAPMSMILFCMFLHGCCLSFLLVAKEWTIKSPLYTAYGIEVSIYMFELVLLLYRNRLDYTWEPVVLISAMSANVFWLGYMRLRAEKVIVWCDDGPLTSSLLST